MANVFENAKNGGKDRKSKDTWIQAKQDARYAELAEDKSAPLADFLRNPSLLPKSPPSRPKIRVEG